MNAKIAKINSTRKFVGLQYLCTLMTPLMHIGPKLFNEDCIMYSTQCKTEKSSSIFFPKNSKTCLIHYIKG